MSLEMPVPLLISPMNLIHWGLQLITMVMTLWLLHMMQIAMVPTMRLLKLLTSLVYLV